MESDQIRENIKNNKLLSFDSENFKNFKNVQDSKEERIRNVKIINKPEDQITYKNPLTREKENQFDYMSNFSNPKQQNDKLFSQKGTIRYRDDEYN